MSSPTGSTLRDRGPRQSKQAGLLQNPHQRIQSRGDDHMPDERRKRHSTSNLISSGIYLAGDLRQQSPANLGQARADVEQSSAEVRADDGTGSVGVLQGALDLRYLLRSVPGGQAENLRDHLGN